MKRILRQLWRDNRGEVTYVSVLLMYTILGIGAITGLVCLRNQIVQEFGDLSVALDHLDQSYSVSFTSDCPPYSYEDSPSLDDPDGEPPADIVIDLPPAAEGGGGGSNSPGED